MIRLFRKKIERCCAYCARSTTLDEDTVLCTHKGVRCIDGKCRKFRYDPCKRIPARPAVPDFEKYESCDFSL